MRGSSQWPKRIRKEEMSEFWVFSPASTSCIFTIHHTIRSRESFSIWQGNYVYPFISMFPQEILLFMYLTAFIKKNTFFFIFTPQTNKNWLSNNSHLEFRWYFQHFSYIKSAQVKLEVIQQGQGNQALVYFPLKNMKMLSPFASLRNKSESQWI